MRTNRLWIGAFMVIAVASTCGCDSAKRIAGVPATFTSRRLCSAVFVGGLDPATYDKEAIAAKFGAAAKLVHYEVDREQREVRFSLAECCPAAQPIKDRSAAA